MSPTAFQFSNNSCPVFVHLPNVIFSHPTLKTSKMKGNLFKRSVRTNIASASVYNPDTIRFPAGILITWSSKGHYRPTC